MSDKLAPGPAISPVPGTEGVIGVAMRLTVSVRGSLGLDDDRRLIGELEKATGLAWRREPVKAGDLLDGGIVEIVLLAVVGKTTELAYGAVVEKVRSGIEQWRREHLDETDYTLAEEIVADAGESVEADGVDGGDTRQQDQEPGG